MTHKAYVEFAAALAEARDRADLSEARERAAAIRYAHIPIPNRPVTDIDVRKIRDYIPENYTVARASTFGNDGVLLMGQDNAGWTLDGYVIPRLASGLIFAREISADERDVILDEARATDEIETYNLRGITAPDY